MSSARTAAVRLYWALTLASLAAAVLLVVRAPVEVSMGPVQKLLYLHLPIALNTFLAALVVFIASVGYVGARSQHWDDLAEAAARVTVLNGTVLLITGMFWARVAWGVWWTWSPRMAFSLLLWLLYLAYLVLRPALHSPARRAIVCAVYGVVAFLDVPLVYLSVKMLPDKHPGSMELDPTMLFALLFWFVPVTLLTGGLIAARYSLTRRLWADQACASERGAPHGIKPTGMPT